MIWILIIKIKIITMNSSNNDHSNYRILFNSIKELKVIAKWYLHVQHRTSQNYMEKELVNSENHWGDWMIA